MSTRKLAVLLGHSHTGALVHAVTTRAIDPRTDRDDLHLAMFKMYDYDGNPPYLVPEAGGADRFNPMIFDGLAHFVADLGPPVYLTSFGGNDWAVLSVMKHAAPFDFILPEAPGLPTDPEVELVPFQYIKAILVSLTDRYLYQMHHLRKATDAPIYLFLPPPPIGDNAVINEKMDDFFRKHTDFTGTIGHPALRLKMWLLQRQIYREVCATNDVTVLDIPAEASTPDGYLAPAYHGRDATHANTAYGELMLRQIEEAMGAGLRSWYWFPE